MVNLGNFRAWPVLVRVFLLAWILFSGIGCENDTPADPPLTCTEQSTSITISIRDELDALITDADFTLAIKSTHGKTFSHSTGNSTGLVMYRSASTSKLVTAAVILSVVRDGFLSLTDHPQNHLDFWPTTGNLAAIELRHLLSFTSGLVNDPLCFNFPNADFESCVENIVDLNSNSVSPGREFYYSPNHLQVAGLMAIKAAGLSSWQELFGQFKTETGLFTQATYDLPSTTNPRLAGGMHWNAEEYLAFLETLFNKEILTPGLIQAMMLDQLSEAEIGYSPALDSLGEDWHYGYGIWIECHANSFNCPQTTRASCPGAYGAYPFLDFKHGYYGILAREGALGTFDKGYEVFMSVVDKLETWAGLDCNEQFVYRNAP